MSNTELTDGQVGNRNCGVRYQVNQVDIFAPYSPPYTHFVDRILYWAENIGDHVAYRFLDKVASAEGEDEFIEVTFAELSQRARAIGAHLMAKGYSGQRALMMYPPSLEFIAAFFGCHCAGITPVPMYPPRRNRNMGRINAITRDADAAVCLTVESVAELRAPGGEQVGPLYEIPWVSTDLIRDDMADHWSPPPMSPESPALIQYTSGSTGQPKGVVLTQKNLFANCKMISTAFQMSRTNAVCNWLPLYHDMGLIGGTLTPMYMGYTANLMSPIAFLTKPIRWLQAISRYRCTEAGGPNFAYALCTEKITDEQCAGLDLSSWATAFNGAEPVRADIMEAFTKKFEPFGFRHAAFYPCYGMAETTLIVTGGKRNDEPIVRDFDKHALVEHHVEEVSSNHPNAKQLVGCGQVIDEEEVLIVNPETRRVLPENKIGEIWINSPSGGKGYWNKPEATEETFHAKVSPDNGKQYIRSGDLGFMDRSELFVSGRLKDMIIVRGVNRYPQDIEATVESCDDRINSGGSAAFSIDRFGGEQLIIVCEVKRNAGHKSWDNVINKIRSSVADQHDLPPGAIVLVRAHSVPKTSSGKTQRHACRKKFEQDELKTIERWVAWDESGYRDSGDNGMGTTTAPTTNVQAVVWTDEDLRGLSPVVVEAVVYFVKAVGKEQAKEVSIDTNIVRLGIDSLARADIASDIGAAFGGQLPETVLQEVETVREVAEAIQKHVGSVPVVDYKRASTNGSTGQIKGEIPESYYQLEKMPEFVRLQRLRRLIDSTKLRNPFFSVHEGKIGDTTRIDGRDLISFASYNYLGLSGEESVSASAKDAIDEFGTSVSASRIVSGEKTLHKVLEAELAEFLDVGDIMTFPGGHATNESVIGHVLGRGDLIIHDSLAHNSIIQGAELSGARRRAFDHNDWRQLDSILKEVRHSYRRVMIAIEGLYSMDGDYPDLPKFVEVKNRHKAWLFVDEAHSIGTLGKTGRGLAEVYGVPRTDVEFWMGTLSKSFGSCGGFIGGTKQLIEFLRYTTPGYVFAAGMPPANAGAALGSLRMLKQHPERVAKLQSNSALFLKLAREAGLETGLSVSGTPIIPILTYRSLRALRLSEALFNCGINVQPILHPAVTEDQARVRIFMTAIHTEDQIRHCVETIAREWEKINVEQGDPDALPA